MPPRVEHEFIDDVEHKLCKGIVCVEESENGVWKVLSEFGSDKQSWDGLRSLCRGCKNAAERRNYAGESVKKVKPPKEPKEVKPIGRPVKYRPHEIKDYLAKYGLQVLDEIEEIQQMSLVIINYVCDSGHESTTRFDTLKQRIGECESKSRHDVCTDCNYKSIEVQQELDSKTIVEARGYILKNTYKNERNAIIYDILCKQNHLTEGRSKTSFVRGFHCEECQRTALKYACGRCKQILPLDQFYRCESNVYRNKTDHDCKKCRQKQRHVRKANNYKMPSKPTITKDGIEGKKCCRKDCGFHPYTDYWKDSSYKDGYSNCCKVCKAAMNKAYNQANKGRIAIRHRLYVWKNRQRITTNRKKWIANNLAKFKKHNRNYMKARREKYPVFKLKGNLRHRINLALKQDIKSASTMALLGCTVEELWQHLESQFTEGMTKENYGPTWHVDHIIPCNAFNLSSEREQQRCFNWRNLQPMFALDNIIKGDTYLFDVVKEIELYTSTKNLTLL